MPMGQVEDDRPQISLPVTPAAALQMVYRGVPRLWRVMQADHITRYRSQLRADSGNTEGFKVYVACGPARRIKPSSLVSCRTAVEGLARAVFGDLLPSGPEVGRAELVRFRVDRPSGGNVHLLHVHNDGLIELVWEILAAGQVGADPGLDLLDIGRPLARVVAATRSPEYLEIFGRRRLRDRLDWYFSVNAYLAADGGSVYWKRLLVEGEALNPWGTSPPFAPLGGYGGKALYNRRRLSDPQALVLAALTDFTESNGFDIPRAALARAAEEALPGVNGPGEAGDGQRVADAITRPGASTSTG